MTWMTSIFAFRDFSENGREFTPRTFVRLDNSERNEISVERKTLMWTLKGRDSPEAETKERLAECFSILFFVVRVRVYSRTTKYTITIHAREATADEPEIFLRDELASGCHGLRASYCWSVGRGTEKFDESAKIWNARANIWEWSEKGKE